MAEIEHLSDVLLVKWLEENLPVDELQRVGVHLETCALCEQRLETLEPAFVRYQRVREVRLPCPPAPWANIGAQMRNADRAPGAVILKPRAQWVRPFWGAALAAGILIAAMLFWPQKYSSLHAGTLLQSARSAPVRRSGRARIELRTRMGSHLRPALLRPGSPEAPELDSLRAHFEAAHYDWNDPLSAAAFSDWRGQLAKETDQVSDRGDRYVVHTATSQGALRDAELTLNAKTLAPESARLNFTADGWVEIVSAPDAPESLPSPVAPSLRESGPPSAPAPTMNLAERELLARLAIDRLHAPIGEPIDIDVSPDGRVVVTPYRPDAQLRQQLRTGLAGIEGVMVRLPKDGDRVTGSPSPTGVPLDAAIGAGNTIASRVQLLRQLAERFPPDVAAMLTPDSLQALREMRIRNAHELERDIETLLQILARDDQFAAPLSAWPSSTGFAEAPSMHSLVESAVAVNRLVTGLHSNGSTRDDPQWRQLSMELARLEILARKFTETAESGQ
jgi:hypothetical protein